jgi:hypothetical protein
MKKILTNLFIVILFLLSFNAVKAADKLDTGVKTDISGNTCADGQVCIANPLDGKYNSDYTPQKFIGNIIKALLGVIGSIALIMFVYGGFMWMTAAGDKNKVTKGMDTMLWAVLGLTVIFSSYALVRFVIEKVGS